MISEFNAMSTDFSSPLRHGITERVTGRLLLAADLRFPELLHAKLVTLPCAHARILEVVRRRFVFPVCGLFLPPPIYPNPCPIWDRSSPTVRSSQ